MPQLSDLSLVHEAIALASIAHQGQLRKDNRTPYVSHPLRVTIILACEFGVEDRPTLAAGALHDTIEDTTVDRDDLLSRFGPEVAEYVALLSKDKRLPEKEREERFLEQLTAAPLEVKLCKLADSLDNLRDSSSLAAKGRAKGVAKARRLIAAFEPHIPEEWRHALELLRQQIEVAERG